MAASFAGITAIYWKQVTKGARKTYHAIQNVCTVARHLGSKSAITRFQIVQGRQFNRFKF